MRNAQRAVTLFLLAFLPRALGAQDPVAERPAPFHAVEDEATPGELRLRLDPALHAELRALPRVVLRGFPLPHGGFVDLELEQREWRGVVGVPRVDGVERMDLFLAHDLTTWRGSVAGDPASLVYLGFSRHGTNGFVRFGDELYLVRGRSGPDGGSRLVVQDARAGDGIGPGVCGTDPAPPDRGGEAPSGPRSQPPAPAPDLAISAQHARIAVSVDYWVSTFFTDVDAEIAYVYQLLWSVCDLYYSELAHPLLDFVLTVPYVELWTMPGDPWDNPDAGTDNKDEVLEEFEDKWDTVFEDEKVHLALLMCGQTIGGGKASGVGIAAEICEGVFATLGEHSVVGNINNQMTFPPVQGMNTWEFFVIAHELGHNLGALHTHELGIDNCDEEDPGDCPEGTLMSYCHICPNPGSSTTGNIKLEFHPANVDLMWFKLDDQDCLPLIGFEPIYVDASFGGWPDGTPGGPYASLFEGVRLAETLGGPASTVQVQGALPGGLSGVQEWPAMLFGVGQLGTSGIVLEPWVSGTGATIGE